MIIYKKCTNSKCRQGYKLSSTIEVFEQIVTHWPSVRRLYRLLTAATLLLSSGPSAPLILIKFAICNFLFGPFLFHCKWDIFICKFNGKCSDFFTNKHNWPSVKGFFRIYYGAHQILNLWRKITLILYQKLTIWGLLSYSLDARHSNKIQPRTHFKGLIFEAHI